MGDIVFTQHAWEEYIQWQQQDKKTLKRINQLIQSMSRTPFEGEGKPEALRGDLSGKWSRRIDARNRLVYTVVGETITILQCRTHYDEH